MSELAGRMCRCQGNRTTAYRKTAPKRGQRIARGGAGMRSVVGGGPVVDAEELARVQTQIEENARSLADLRAPAKVVDFELKETCDVLLYPSAHLYVESRCIRIDLLNVVQGKGQQSGREIEFHSARIPGNQPEIVRSRWCACPRVDLQPGGLRIDAAMRGL